MSEKKRIPADFEDRRAADLRRAAELKQKAAELSTGKTRHGTRYQNHRPMPIMNPGQSSVVSAEVGVKRKLDYESKTASVNPELYHESHSATANAPKTPNFGFRRRRYDEGPDTGQMQNTPNTGMSTATLPAAANSPMGIPAPMTPQADMSQPGAMPGTNASMAPMNPGNTPQSAMQSPRGNTPQSGMNPPIPPVRKGTDSGSADTEMRFGGPASSTGKYASVDAYGIENQDLENDLHFEVKYADQTDEQSVVPSNLSGAQGSSANGTNYFSPEEISAFNLGLTHDVPPASSSEQKAKEQKTPILPPEDVELKDLGNLTPEERAEYEKRRRERQHQDPAMGAMTQEPMPTQPPMQGGPPSQLPAGDFGEGHDVRYPVDHSHVPGDRSSPSFWFPKMKRSLASVTVDFSATVSKFPIVSISSDRTNQYALGNYPDSESLLHKREISSVSNFHDFRKKKKHCDEKSKNFNVGVGGGSSGKAPPEHLHSYHSHGQGLSSQQDISAYGNVSSNQLNREEYMQWPTGKVKQQPGMGSHVREDPTQAYSYAGAQDGSQYAGRTLSCKSSSYSNGTDPTQSYV